MQNNKFNFLRLTLLTKRVFDIIFSISGFLVTLPFWVIIPLAIYLKDGRPILFSDTRVGRNKKFYKHFKFRSMAKEAEKESGPVWAAKQDLRVTKVGRILRKTALDELPQLINILKGDMSVVGPRPERPFFVDKFIEKIPGYERRLTVKPGLTGMAQVYGKYDTPAKKKLAYDLEYIGKMNILLDLKLVFLSLLITLSAGWMRFEQEG